MNCYRPWFTTIALMCVLGTGGCAAFRSPSDPSSWSYRASRSLMQTGVAARDSGQDQEARVSLSGAVRLCPKNGEARWQYAEYLWAQDDYSAALKQMSEAIPLLPENAAVRRRMTEMLLANDQTEWALEPIMDAIDLDPDCAQGWYLCGQVEERLGHENTALHHYQRAAMCEPGNIEIRESMALLYLRQDRPEQAILTIHTLMDRTTDEDQLATAYRMEARVYAYLGQETESERCYAMADRYRSERADEESITHIASQPTADFIR